MYEIPVAVPLYVLLFVAFGVFLLFVFRYELDMPLALGFLVVPPIILLGLVLAYLLHRYFYISMFEAEALLGAALLVVVGVYEFIRSGFKTSRRRRPS